MYGTDWYSIYIFPCIYHKHQLNVGKYTIHGSYGNTGMANIMSNPLDLKRHQETAKTLFAFGWKVLNVMFFSLVERHEAKMTP